MLISHRIVEEKEKKEPIQPHPMIEEEDHRIVEEKEEKKEPIQPHPMIEEEDHRIVEEKEEKKEENWEPEAVHPPFILKKRCRRSQDSWRRRSCPACRTRPGSIRAFFLLQLIHGTYSCPPDQIYQKVTGHCCYPVFNCRPGTGVVFCTKNGTNDTCTPCQGGTIQPQLVSSLDGIDAMCFSDENQYDCTSDEVIPAREERPPCGLPCVCKYDNCYYGNDTCRCKIKEPQSCSVDMTMDKTTGECVKCPKYTFKNNTGCGLCYYNETEWFNDHRKGISTMFTPLTSIGVIDESEYNRSKEVESLSGVDILPVAVVIAVSVVGFGVVLILVYIFRQRLKKKWQYMCRKCQNRSAEEYPESQTPVMEVRPVVQYCNDAQHKQNHDLNSVGCDRPAVILPVAEPTLDDSLCQRDESEQDQTYLKEVVNSQTHNEQEGFHSGTFEISMLSPGEAANEYCIIENAHELQEEPATQTEEEENEDEEVVPFIAQ